MQHFINISYGISLIAGAILCSILLARIRRAERLERRIEELERVTGILYPWED